MPLKAKLSLASQIKNAARGGSIYLVTPRGPNSNHILDDMLKFNKLRRIL
jgi:hypothetical protein